MIIFRYLNERKKDLEKAEWVRDQFLNAGLDRSYLVPTHQLLSAIHLPHPRKNGLRFIDTYEDVNSTDQPPEVYNVIATIHGDQEPGETTD